MKVATAIRYNPILANTKSLYDPFDDPRLVSFAARNEYSGVKLLVSELVRLDLIKLTRHSPYGLGGGEKRSEDRRRGGAKINGLSLLIKKEIEPCAFLQVTVTNEDYDVQLMPWMCPIMYWGSPAEAEPVWRRLGMLELIRMARVAQQKQNISVSPLLLKSFSMKEAPQKRETFSISAQRKVRSGPLMNSKKRPIAIAPAAVGVLKKSEKQRAVRIKRETGLACFENKVERWSQNILYFLQERVRTKRMWLEIAIDEEREKQFAELEKKCMQWEDSLSCLVVVDSKFKVSQEEPPVVVSKGCFSFIFGNKHAKIAAAIGDKRAMNSYIDKHRQILARPPDAAAFQVLRHRVFTEGELNFRRFRHRQCQQTRAFSMESNQQSDSKENSRPPSFIQSNKSETQINNRIAKLKLARRQQIIAKKKAQIFNIIQGDDKVVQPIIINGPMVSVAETWVCGGASVILVVCRVIFDARRNPRGEIRTAVYKCREPTPCLSRLGFVTRELCSDRADKFAVTMTLNRKYLSEKALLYLRGTERPLREQPTLLVLCRSLCECFLQQRFDLLLNNSEQVRALKCFQVICRAKMTKCKLRAERKSNSPL